MPTSPTHPDHPPSPESGDFPVVVLASASPRRRELLDNAGVTHQVQPAKIDDGDLNPSNATNPEQWVLALAYLKATSSSRAYDADADPQATVVLGADTVCVHKGQIIGQPTDRAHAKQIINQMSDDTHEVLTGVAIIDPITNRRDLFVDRSVVSLGSLTEEQIESYLDTNLWKGKAGAYNITERLAAGWPIKFTGDETSIVGLPLTRVLERVKTFHPQQLD